MCIFHEPGLTKFVMGEEGETSTSVIFLYRKPCVSLSMDYFTSINLSSPFFLAIERALIDIASTLFYNLGRKLKYNPHIIADCTEGIYSRLQSL